MPRTGTSRSRRSTGTARAIREYEAAHVARGRDGPLGRRGEATAGWSRSPICRCRSPRRERAQPGRHAGAARAPRPPAGRAVKAAVLRELAATLPEVRRISTYNSDSNLPMVAVNEALGFRPAGHLSSWSRACDPLLPPGRAARTCIRSPCGPNRQSTSAGSAPVGERVRHAGVELGDLAGLQHRRRARRAAAAAGRRARRATRSPRGTCCSGSPARPVRREDLLERLQPARPAGQRDDRDAVAVERARVDPRVAGRGRVDQLVQRHLVRPGQRQQQLQGRPALPGLQPGQRAHRDAGRRRQLGRGSCPARCRSARSRGPTAGEDVVVRIRRLPYRQRYLSIGRDGVDSRRQTSGRRAEQTWTSGTTWW